MLVNLLSNAVKFTPEGGQVRLGVTMNVGEEQIELAVEDTGMGISPANQSKLFQPFIQLDSALSREFEGTGLGLALVKRLAEQHGGTVRVKSEGVAGRGSCFTIVLPAALVDETELPPAVDPARTIAAAAPTKGPVKTRILLAEDNEANIATVSFYLEHLGYRVIVARTGPEALANALDTQPDLILMDIQLPQMDGLEVTRRLRQSPNLAATPIIAVTALAMRGDRERCLEAGTTEYMSKPLRLKELTALIERLLSG